MADIDPTQGSTLLGKQVGFPQHPDQAELECVPYLNLFKDSIGQFPPAIIRYTCPEFTSLCPKTGQPDFAHITIDYAPDKLLVESKALKLYMGSFRNHGMFHETTTLRIAHDFCQACAPIWLRIIGIWYPRGGIPIDIFWQSGEPPKNAMLPMVNYKHYRGR